MEKRGDVGEVVAELVQDCVGGHGSTMLEQRTCGCQHKLQTFRLRSVGQIYMGETVNISAHADDVAAIGEQDKVSTFFHNRTQHSLLSIECFIERVQWKRYLGFKHKRTDSCFLLKGRTST